MLAHLHQVDFCTALLLSHLVLSQCLLAEVEGAILGAAGTSTNNASSTVLRVAVMFLRGAEPAGYCACLRVVRLHGAEGLLVGLGRQSHPHRIHLIRLMLKCGFLPNWSLDWRRAAENGPSTRVVVLFSDEAKLSKDV